MNSRSCRYSSAKCLLDSPWFQSSSVFPLFLNLLILSNGSGDSSSLDDSLLLGSLEVVLSIGNTSFDGSGSGEFLFGTSSDRLGHVCLLL